MLVWQAAAKVTPGYQCTPKDCFVEENIKTEDFCILQSSTIETDTYITVKEELLEDITIKKEPVEYLEEMDIKKISSTTEPAIADVVKPISLQTEKECSGQPSLFDDPTTVCCSENSSDTNKHSARGSEKLENIRCSPDNKKRILQCKSSEYRTGRNVCMNNHVHHHTDELLHCEHCEYKTSYSSDQTHVRRHTGNLLQCQHCEYSTIYSRDLKEHVRRETGDMLQCQHCKYRTAYSRNMKWHVRRHTGNLLQCEHCEDSKKHVRLHTGDLLQCEHCEYRTAYSKNMKWHVQRHTGNLLQCEHCEYSTVYYPHLKAHVRRHTRDLLKCEHCEYTTRYSRYLKSRQHFLKSQQKGCTKLCFETKNQLLINKAVIATANEEESTLVSRE